MGQADTVLAPPAPREAAAQWRLSCGGSEREQDNIFGVHVLSCVRELVWCTAVAVLLRVCFGCWAAFCSSVYAQGAWHKVLLDGEQVSEIF